jgi:hypothetical protein
MWYWQLPLGGQRQGPKTIKELKIEGWILQRCGDAKCSEKRDHAQVNLLKMRGQTFALLHFFQGRLAATGS